VSDLRIGTGFDAHALEPGVPLVLGGVAFDSARGLAGHSDGDVITHALIDALLGAAGLGDIGSMFPPDDPELKGISSVKLLREAYGQVRRSGYELVNADVVFVGEDPRLAPVRAQMQEALVAALDLDDASRISVRATTTDGLGFTGRGEGLAAQAVALLERAI
jgi:2-C-methyl-D-erythritol 2,4-cyclodiphosphate synthase